MSVAPRFLPAVRAVEALAAGDRYVGALLFGSVAEGAAAEASDLDVRVLVADDNPCQAINHPRIGGVKVDITFCSLRQLEGQLEAEIEEGRRAPMVARGVILFDKTGSLAGVKARADAAQPPVYDPADAQLDRFMLHHANDKVQRALVDDPASALWSMHATVNDVIGIHYRVHGRFKVSSKKLLSDLDVWDAPLGELLRRFVSEGGPKRKFECWSAIVDHVGASFGSRLPLEENVCSCRVCAADLAALHATAS
jgi:predicted nucleotidyltransferase